MARKKTPLKDLPHIGDELSLAAILSKPVLLETLTRRTAGGRASFLSFRMWECVRHLAARFPTRMSPQETDAQVIIRQVGKGNLRVLDFKRLTKRTEEQCVTCGERMRKRRALIAREQAEREARRADH